MQEKHYNIGLLNGEKTLSLTHFVQTINMNYICSDCGNVGKNEFYEQLKCLKRQNIQHLESLEVHMNERNSQPKAKSRLSGKDEPLFVLDVPCCCDKKNISVNRDHAADEDSISDMFSGITDSTDEDDLSEQLNAMISSTKSGKKKLRVQSAPITISTSCSRPNPGHIFRYFCSKCCG